MRRVVGLLQSLLSLTKKREKESSREEIKVDDDDEVEERNFMRALSKI